MKDLQTILRRAEELDEAGESYVLATVVQTSGSVYRGPGTRMLIEADLQSLGTISGGCLEGDVRENAQAVFADGLPRLLHYDATSEDDILWGTGLGCSGTVDVLLERLPQDAPFHYPTFLHGCALENRHGVLVTVFATEGETNAAPGQHLILDEAGKRPRRHRRLGAARDCAQRRQRNPCYPRRHPTPHRPRTHSPLRVDARQGRPAHRASAAPHRPLSLRRWLRRRAPRPASRRTRLARLRRRPSCPPMPRAERFPWARQVLLAQPGHLPEDLQFDNRSCAVIMSHNYLQDQALLRDLLDAPLAYLGVLGPHQRTQRLLADLQKEGITPSDEQIARLFSPVGLDIGAETAEEIALSILSEIQAALTGRKGGSLRDHTGPIHDRPA